MKKRTRALCLQGGGAKGAYQAGALKALTERGYRFDCAVGASVGSLNAALVCLGKVDELYRVWRDLDFSDVLPIERNADGGLSLRSIASAAIGAIRSSGVDTSRIRSILEKYVDEDALRASKIRFGLVTVKQEGKINTLCKLFIEDIPKGRVIDYMMASAALPFFKKVEIDGVRYLDGGLMDNLPIEMLATAGYRDITAIRLGGDIRYATSKPIKVEYFDPSESAGHTINFSNVAITRSLHLGYYDTLRKLDGLFGKKYYIKPFKMRAIRRLLRGKKDLITELLSEEGVCVRGTLRKRVAVLTYALAGFIGVKGEETEVWTALAELVAKQIGANRWQAYRIEELLDGAKRLPAEKEEDKKDDGTRKALHIARALVKER